MQFPAEWIARIESQCWQQHFRGRSLKHSRESHAGSTCRCMDLAVRRPKSCQHWGSFSKINAYKMQTAAARQRQRQRLGLRQLPWEPGHENAKSKHLIVVNTQQAMLGSAVPRCESVEGQGAGAKTRRDLCPCPRMGHLGITYNYCILLLNNAKVLWGR